MARTTSRSRAKRQPKTSATSSELHSAARSARTEPSSSSIMKAAGSARGSPKPQTFRRRSNAWAIFPKQPGSDRSLHRTTLSESHDPEDAHESDCPCHRGAVSVAQSLDAWAELCELAHAEGPGRPI